MSKKSAIARLLSDFIKADQIIAEGEMNALSKFSIEYNICDSDKVAAMNMKFSDAIEELRGLTYSQRKQLISDFAEMTLSDGRCVPQEAMLLIAVNYCLGVDRKYFDSAKVLCSDTVGLQLDRYKVIYVEGKYDEKINNQIKENLRNIRNELGVIGIDFVYIPEVGSDFAAMSSTYLNDVISYLAPNLSRQQRQSVYNALCQIDTAYFCRHLLGNKLGIKDVANTEPALLVTVGSTSMPYVSPSDGAVTHKSYNHFLKIAIGDDVMDVVKRFVDCYKRYVDVLVSTAMAPEINRLMYYGFNRTLFDLLIYTGKKQDCTLMFDLRDGSLSFLEINEPLKIYTKQKAFYLTMLQQTLCSGEGCMLSDDVSLKVFRELYFKLGSSKWETSEFESDFNTLLSNIRKSLRHNHPLVKNMFEFLPDRGKNCRVKVPVQSERVMVTELDGTKVLMVNSSLRCMGIRKKD
ncbi:MAG: hypothetical protein ACI308_10595 [Muribaculaceae bacterium]